MNSQGINNSGNGSKKLGQWIADKGIIFALMLITSLMIWLVSQVFNLSSNIEAMRLENTQRLYESQTASSEKIAQLSTQMEVIAKTLDGIDKRLDSVCIELKIR